MYLIGPNSNLGGLNSARKVCQKSIRWSSAAEIRGGPKVRAVDVTPPWTFSLHWTFMGDFRTTPQTATGPEAYPAESGALHGGPAAGPPKKILGGL